MKLLRETSTVRLPIPLCTLDLPTDLAVTTGIKWILACAAIYITAFLFGLDTTIAADVQASVIETFGNVSQLSWVGAGFPLGSVSVILAM